MTIMLSNIKLLILKRLHCKPTVGPQLWLLSKLPDDDSCN